MACHCNEFSRAHMMRNAVAQAGKGLPQDREGDAASGRHRAVAAVVPAALRHGRVLGVRGLAARPRPAPRRDRERAGLELYRARQRVPRRRRRRALGHPPVNGAQANRYNDFRPGLRLPAGAGTQFQPNGDWRWLPEAGPLDDIQRGLPVGGNPTVGMAVFPTIGYTDPDQSHFTSRHYWEVGKLDANMRTGWMGRLLDRIGTDDNPLQGLSLDGWLSPGLATASKPVAAIDGTEYDLWAPGVWDDTQVSDEMFVALEDIGDAHALNSEGGRKTAGRVTQQATGVRTQLERLRRRHPAARLPGPLVRREPRRARGDAARRPRHQVRGALRRGRLRHARQPGRRTSATIWASRRRR